MRKMRVKIYFGTVFPFISFYKILLNNITKHWIFGEVIREHVFILSENLIIDLIVTAGVL